MPHCWPAAIFEKRPMRTGSRAISQGADKLFARYLDFRAKLKDPTIEWQHALWEYSTGRKDQAIARLQKSPDSRKPPCRFACGAAI